MALKTGQRSRVPSTCAQCAVSVYAALVLSGSLRSHNPAGYGPPTSCPIPEILDLMAHFTITVESRHGSAARARARLEDLGSRPRYRWAMGRGLHARVRRFACGTFFLWQDGTKKVLVCGMPSVGQCFPPS